MSLTNSSLPVVSANDTSTYYMSMLPVTSGQTSQEYVNPKITFNPQTNQLLINNQLNLGFTSSANKPTNPEVGDKWYDTTSDITFQYIFDGLIYNWIDISGLTIPTNIYPKRSFSITANNGVINETATGLGILNNVTTFAVTTSNIPDDTPLTWINTGTAGAERFLDGLNSGTVNIKNNTGTIIRQATPSGRFYSNNYMQLSLYNNLDGGQLTQVANSAITYINNEIEVSYLIVGGGGGGSEYGGGGAGGVATGTTRLKSGTNYAITVGSGGAGNLPLTPPNPTWSGFGINGSNSSISASGFTSIVAIGGGSGGNPGGSGGGGGPYAAACGIQPSQNPGIPGVTNLGNPGGLKNSCSTGGGGGGAGGAGVPICRPSVSKGGGGGAGYTWPFTGNTYAGGGGGSAGSAPPGFTTYLGGPGGTGGGGPGASPSVSISGTPGTNGLGGGGGGAGGNPGAIRGAGGTGGNGTIIIAMPSLVYTPKFGLDANTVTTPPAAPGMTVLTYTSNSALNLGCGAPGVPYSVNYLAVAGGGGGGGSNRGNQSAQGGGAGGLLTGTVKLTVGQTYTIQVGGGGKGGNGVCGPGASNLNPGFAGNNSIISGSGISTITAIGGGGGGSAMMACGTPGIQPQFGGSGGGGFGPPKAGANAGVAFGSTGFANTGTQGWPGGSVSFGGPTFQSMGLGTASGGGGAGGKGGNSFGNSGSIAQCGNGTGGGGAGYTWPYTANTYAGGGGGGSFNIGPVPRPAAVYGLGGTGGGGRGGTGPCGLTLTANGVNNTGGGGGGGGLCFPNYFGANGGTGIVIVAMPTGAYTGVSAPGAFVSNPPAAPGLTVLTFNGNSSDRNANVTYTFIA
jgi:hypothetical protein